MNSSDAQQNLQPIFIHGINTIGLWTLIKKEVGRFLSVWMQTIIAPVTTTLLYYAVFALAFGERVRDVGDVPFLEFLAPGLIMMNMAQNAFANSSSSLIISKVQGNIVDLLMPPLSSLEIYLGFTIGAVARGMAVGIATVIVISFFIEMSVDRWWVIIAFGFLGSMMLGTLGTIAGIWAEKFDHLAAVSNFVVMPLTFLSGTFYSMKSLPEMWQHVALYNPVFYMIDGFRTGFVGQGDQTIWLGLSVLIVVNIALSAICLWMLRVGYKIKS